MLPRTPEGPPCRSTTRAPDPEAELRTRLILYKRLPRRRGGGSELAAVERRRPVPPRAAAALAAGVAGARPRRRGRRSIRTACVAALGRAGQGRPADRAAARGRPRVDHARPARGDHPRARSRAPRRVVLQDLLLGVRDRVVIAVTFLAMLELMKRREIVVEQDEPWGPIMARRTTAEERAAAGVDRRRSRRPSTSRWSRSRDRGDRPRADDRRDRRPRRRADARRAIELTEAPLEALLFVAERPLSRREIAASPGSTARPSTSASATSRCRLRTAASARCSSGDRVELATAPEAGALDRTVCRRGRGPRCRRRRSRRWRSWPTASRSPRPASSASAAWTRTTRSAALLHRRLVVELGRSSAPGRPILYGTAFDFLERFGLDEPRGPAAARRRGRGRLAEEGGAQRAAPAPDDAAATPTPAHGGGRWRGGATDAAERIQKVLAPPGSPRAGRPRCSSPTGRVTVDGKVGDRRRRRSIPAVAAIAVDGRADRRRPERRLRGCSTSRPA